MPDMAAAPPSYGEVAQLEGGVCLAPPPATADRAEGLDTRSDSYSASLTPAPTLTAPTLTAAEKAAAAAATEAEYEAEWKRANNLAKAIDRYQRGMCSCCSCSCVPCTGKPRSFPLSAALLKMKMKARRPMNRLGLCCIPCCARDGPCVESCDGVANNYCSWCCLCCSACKRNRPCSPVAAPKRGTEHKTCAATEPPASYSHVCILARGLQTRSSKRPPSAVTWRGAAITLAGALVTMRAFGTFPSPECICPSRIDR